MGTRVRTNEDERLERADLRIVWSALSHVGKVRDVNEDSFLATAGMWVVADGMGGHSAGRAASEIVIDTCMERTGGEPLSLEDVPSMLDSANQKVRKRSLADGHETMGATVCGVALVDNGGEDALLAFNVGDSRCYALDPVGSLTQLTTDHSYVQELVDRGEIRPEDARTHPNKNVVSRAIGIEESVSADFLLLPKDPACRLLLCSDGVSGELGDDAIAVILREASTPAEASVNLLAEVLSGPARDNATVVVLDVVWTGVDSISASKTDDGETTIPRSGHQPDDDGAGTESDIPQLSVIDQVPGFVAPDAVSRSIGPLVDRVPGHLALEEIVET